MSVSAGTAGVVADIREKLRGKIGQTKVHRYWPGKKPEWAGEEKEDDEEEEVKQEEKKDVEPVKSVKDDDPRLRRLAESRRNRDETVARHRQIRQAEVVSTKLEENEEEVAIPDEKQVEKVYRVPDDDAVEDEDVVEEKRRRNRERILQKQREEEAAAMEVDGAEEEDDDEDAEDEYETDSEDEVVPMVKPIFVRKSERETIAERERLEAEEIALEEEMRKKLELRKVETKHMVVEEIKKEEEREKNKVEDVEGEEIDTDEETNEAEEYEAWKAREMSRIRRERDEKEAAAKEKEEVEKLRNMTEEERKEFERKNPKEAPASRSKFRYMQKYYHPGAFFQTETNEKVIPGGNEIYKRDYSEPTGEDKLNRTILPKIMQVKNFGRSSQTKWTHLLNEDTTRYGEPWTANDKLRSSYNSKMAGMNKPIEKPRGSKNMKRNVKDIYEV